MSAEPSTVAEVTMADAGDLNVKGVSFAKESDVVVIPHEVGGGGGASSTLRLESTTTWFSKRSIV